MHPLQHRSLSTLALAFVISGLLAGSLAGCTTRLQQPGAGTPTAGHPVVITTRTSSGQASGPASGTPSNNPADQLDAELQNMESELSNADTLNDINTALPPDQPAATPVAGAPTVAPAANVASPTVAPSGTDEGDEIDQALATLQAELDNTDTVPEAANP